MMQLLIPLGLLGLLGILALIIIYIIKPNYQTKHIPTTFVWKLSLKYKKKRLPTSKIRNVLLFISQVLILVSMAGILAKPAIVHNNNTGELDTIAIIDSSASMYAEWEGETRFSRAVSAAAELSDETIRAGGYASVIVAESTPYYLGRRVGQKDRRILADDLDVLAEESGCSYGASDLDAAIALSEEVLAENPSASIYLYTDRHYTYPPEKVNIVSVAHDGEWNAAILSVTAELTEGYYVVTAEVASYGKDAEIDLTLEVEGANAYDANDEGQKVVLGETVYCSGDGVQTVIFSTEVAAGDESVTYHQLSDDEKFYSFHSLHLNIKTGSFDSFPVDDDYYLYGGQKEVVKVVYASTTPNPFVTSALDTMKNLFSERWDLQVYEVPRGQTIPDHGYDFYIYEHIAPELIPIDGAVVLFHPNITPAGSGISVGSEYEPMFPLYFHEENPHPLSQYLIPSNLYITRYTQVDFEPEYQVVLSAGSVPVLLVKNEEDSKIAVLPFSVHYSNIALQPEWTLLIYNLFDYFLPSTVDKYAYEVGEDVVLNARGPRVTYSKTEPPIEEFPATLTFSTPGSYSFEQELYFNKESPIVNIFVSIPREESDIWAEVDSLEDPYREEVTGISFDDLLIYFAAALVALLFLEWWLQSRDGR